MGVSTDWYVAVEYWRLSLIRIIFVDYQTSELQYNYQSYIQIDNIGDAKDVIQLDNTHSRSLLFIGQV